MAYLPPVILTGITAPANPGDIQNGDVVTEFKPPFIPAAKCAKVEIKFTVDDQPAENVIYLYQASGNFTGAQLYTLAVAVNTAWQDNIIPVWSPNTSLYMVRCSDMSSQTGPVYELAIEPKVPGTRVATDSAIVDNCIGIGLHTGFKGRSANGRTFMAGTCLGDFEASEPTDSARVLFRDAFIAVISELTAAGYILVLVSFQTKKQWRLAAQVTTIVFVSVGQYIYTMRRRLPGHNRHR